jgi:hypothetical protein
MPAPEVNVQLFKKHAMLALLLMGRALAGLTTTVLCGLFWGYQYLREIETIALQQLLVFSALWKNNPIARKYMRTYRSTNLKVEGRGKNNE